MKNFQITIGTPPLFTCPTRDLFLPDSCPPLYKTSFSPPLLLPLILHRKYHQIFLCIISLSQILWVCSRYLQIIYDTSGGSINHSSIFRSSVCRTSKQYIFFNQLLEAPPPTWLSKYPFFLSLNIIPSVADA